MLYIFLSNYNISALKIITASLILIVTCGFLIILFGHKSPYLFAASVLPATVGIGMMRPPSASLLLEQVEKDAGAASSLMSFSSMVVGTLGMQFISMDWNNRIFVFGLIHIVIGLLCLTAWPFIWKKIRTVKDEQLFSQ